MTAPKAYSYVRFSSARQMLGDSLRRQLALAKQYAETHGLQLDEKLSFRDLGVSAYDKSNQERGALSVFLEAVRAGKVAQGSYLLVEQFDRLSRASVLTALDLLRELVEAGIRVVTLSDGKLYDEKSINDLGNLMFTVGVMFRAHEESAEKSKRIRAAWSAKRDRREAVLTKECPRWLRAKKDKSGYEVIPDKADSVKRVFALTEKGLGNVAIARLANKERWPVPGKVDTWHPSLITKILINRAVLGEFQPKVKRNGIRVEYGEAWNAYYPQIIEEELFNRAAAIRRQRKPLPKRRDATYRNIFQGILKCGNCGASFIRKNKTSEKSPGYALYMCSARVRGVTQCKSLSPEKFEKTLIKHIYENSFSAVADDDLADFARTELADKEELLRSCEEKINKFIEAIELAPSVESLVKKLVELENERSKLEAEVKEKKGWVESLKGAYETEERLRDLERTLQKINIPEEAEFRASLHSRFVSAIQTAWVYTQHECIVVRWRSHIADTVVKLSEGSDTRFFECGTYAPPQGEVAATVSTVAATSRGAQP